MRLQWIQPSVWNDMVYDLVTGDERIATYRPLNPWHQSATIESGPIRLRITPNRWQTQWTVTEADGLGVTTISGLFKRTGRFTTADGATYGWERTNLLSGRRVFRHVVDAGARTDVMAVNPSLLSLRTQADVISLSTGIPVRDHILIAGLAMHMIALGRIFLIVLIILILLVLPVIV